MNRKSLFDLNRIVDSNFSGFEGEAMFEGDALGYEGSGSITFAATPESFFIGRNYTLRITNTSTDTLTTYLLPGNLWYPGSTEDGFPLTGAFNSIEGTAGLVGLGRPRPIAEFFAFIAKNPTALLGMKVSSSISVAQVQNSITFQPQSPFNTLQTVVLDLGANQTDQTYRDKVSGPFKMPPQLLASGDMTATLQIEPAENGSNNVVDITFYCGIVNSQEAKTVQAARAAARL